MVELVVGWARVSLQLDADWWACRDGFAHWFIQKTVWAVMLLRLQRLQLNGRFRLNCRWKIVFKHRTVLERDCPFDVESWHAHLLHANINNDYWHQVPLQTFKAFLFGPGLLPLNLSCWRSFETFIWTWLNGGQIRQIQISFLNIFTWLYEFWRLIWTKTA